MQSLLGARSLPASGIGDGIHAVTSSLNRYLQNHPNPANVLLIFGSAVIDLLGIFLLSRWVFLGDIRPFAGLVMVLGLRQTMQACVAMPAPPSGQKKSARPTLLFSSTLPPAMIENAAQAK